MTLSPSPSSWDSSGIKDKSTLYRLIAHALPHGAIFVVDETLRYVLADGPELVAAGLTAADVEGAQVHEIVPAAMLEQCVADYRTALSGATFTREHSVGRRHYRTYGLPLSLPDDERRLALAVSYEVSNQTLHTRQLDILSSLERIGSSTLTSDQVIEAVRTLLCEDFGPSHCVIAEVSCDDNTVRDLAGGLNAGGPLPLVPDCFAKEDIDAFAGTSQNVQAVELHCSLALHFQSDRAIVVPRMAADRLIGFIAIIPGYKQQFNTDDLELLRLIAGVTWNLVERQDVSAKMASSARARERFLAVLGHELRTPLSTLSSATTLLSHQQPTKQASDILAIMERQIQQMHAIVNDLLGLSQLSLETLDIRKDPVDLLDVSATVTAALLGHAQRKQQHLECRVKTDRATVCGDAAKLTQVLTNLVNNAIKYTPRDGHITITISAQEPGQNVLVAVSDTGIGIVADQMPELFDLFERGDPARLAPLPEAGDGLGIGLWIAKRFVEAHGGTLTVTSAGPGLGSTFTIALPSVLPAGSSADV